jgi:phosphomannomutase
MTKIIRFGTDGWRGLIAKDFTFENVARCAQGVADFLVDRGTAAQGLVVGYDTRFLSREFAETVVGVCAGNGIKVYMSTQAAPTPVISFNVLFRHASSAAIITASHNPAAWNGFKFKPEYAGSATQEITEQLEDCIHAVSAVKSVPLQQGRESGLVIDIDPAPPYLERIKSLVELKSIQDSGLRVVVDSMFGAGAGYFPALLSGGSTTVKELHGYANPSFPGMDQPEPIAHNLTELAECLREGGGSVGLALDCDADRIGLMDERGRIITSLEVFSLLALYLLEHKGKRGSIIKGVTSSIMLNKLGERFGVDVEEMEVGFKHIGPRMSEVDAMIGGEESGGFAFRGHIPERDGILSGLYLLEYMARSGKSPFQLLAHLFDQVGPHYYRRLDVHYRQDDKKRIMELLHSLEMIELAGMPVRKSDTIDGWRLMFDDGWLAVRFSGTEPLLRVYAEANHPETVTALLGAAAKYLGI